MPLDFHCPHCKNMIRMQDNAAGMQARCPFCKGIFTAPKLQGATVAATPMQATAPPAAQRPAPVPAPQMPAPQMPAPAPAPQMQRPPAPTPQAKAPAGNACPSCGAKLLEGAVSCMDCGFLIQSEAAIDDGAGAPVLCQNPACGVANPPTEKYCQRCSTPLPTAPGTMLHGRYKIRKLLAMGGFGAVYLAEDTKQNNMEVAIKDMICADPQEFAIRLNFFRREAEILRSLKTIAIVPRFTDLIEQDKTAHLVMEFIRGQNLLQILEANNNTPYSLEQVVEWGKAICDVLAHMHTQSPPLVHRDLKPDNIMLLPDNRSIKMIDFGTARDLGRTAKEQLKAKTRVYTEGYAPPEQIIGKPEPRSDLFALAGTMYHLVTGKAPEGFYTAKEIDAKLAEPGTIPQTERWFYELIRINLSEDVHDRYHSAKEIRKDLDRRQVTREVICPKCSTLNQARDHVYCMKCAEPLTEATPPCHQCGQVNRMGSRCCIYCGNRLR
jgi:predicted Ser/Thr protein kinase